MTNLESLADFFVLSNGLKQTMRYESCPEYLKESVPAHCWQMSLMVSLVAREFDLDIDVRHAMEIAIVHDLGEYTDSKDFDAYFVHTGVLNGKDKDYSEEEAMVNLRDNFSCGFDIYNLWEEYRECKTQEARFVKALDKIESHFHFIQRRCNILNKDNLIFQITYADKAVKNFPSLEPLLRIAKRKLKELMEEQGIIWRDEYNYPD
jgi:putative hydrolases of HD superfamily